MFSWAEVGGMRAAVMGVVNVTPDSFSDGGRWLAPDDAVAHGLALVAAGADLLDVGGESTRPGAAAVDAVEEVRRVEGVIARLAAESGVPVSIDTTKSEVAAAALDAGARIVNDVSAGLNDPDLMSLVAERGAAIVLMHMAGDPRTMQDDPRYDDVVREVGDFLVARSEVARAAGIARSAIAVDPGIGFGKTTAHNLALLAGLDALVDRTAYPVVVGASRKRFIGRVLASVGGEDGEPPADRREDGTLATTVWAAECGVSVVRVHDARAARRAVDLLALLDTVDAARERARERGPSGPGASGARSGRDDGSAGAVRGRWAQGLEPRGFTWIIKDRLAASERPGGFSRNHRKVRRQEELIWLAGNGFTHVLSLLDSSHNLHTYEEAKISYEHLPLGRREDWPGQLRQTYALLSKWLADPEERVLVHHEEFGERLLGVLAGYLLFAFPDVFTSGPQAAVAIERITGRQLGAAGRELVAVTVDEGLIGNA